MIDSLVPAEELDIKDIIRHFENDLLPFMKQDHLFRAIKLLLEVLKYRAVYSDAYILRTNLELRKLYDFVRRNFAFYDTKSTYLKCENIYDL